MFFILVVHLHEQIASLEDKYTYMSIFSHYLYVSVIFEKGLSIALLIPCERVWLATSLKLMTFGQLRKEAWCR